MVQASLATVIGETEIRRGERKKVGIPHDVRDRHLYIIGKTRMGKSTLLTNIAHSDIERGYGVCVIDPHGDLVEDLLETIPEERMRDTIYFNAKDKDYPIPFNIFTAQDEDQVALLADNLLVTFRRLSETWGQRMDDILRATLQTLALTLGATFVDIKRLLQDQAYRARVTESINHPMLPDFWKYDFLGYPKDAPQPIISRINRFLYAPHFYKMFSTPGGAFNISRVMEERKILLVNLASGAIGVDNATMLGSLFVSQIQQAAMARAAIRDRDARVPFYLFVDEFQNFTSSGFDVILSEAGKYNLCLTLAHQFISQLPDSQRDAIFGNVGTMIMFGVGDKDAQSLKNQIGDFEPTDLLNMQKFHALCRPTTAARDTFLFKTQPPPPRGVSHAAAIIAHTRATYSVVAERQEPKAEPVCPAPPPASHAPELLTANNTARPARATPKTGTIKEQIVSLVSQAGYLSTSHIIELCFESYKSEGSKKKGASVALKDLVEGKAIKEKTHEGRKIYFTGREPNVRAHDLSIRNLLVKIIKSDYEIASIKLSSELGSLLPDLQVSFRAEDGSELVTYWEYDAGTEGHKVLENKATEYAKQRGVSRVVFVFETAARAENAAARYPTPFISFAVLDQIQSLDSTAFKTAQNQTGAPLY